ncbi:DUF4405 domain-containing protein [Salipiger abyssi]|uniref:DUF4405 domain-containing protein n=1 Tax=Salipiger abyssi TaxID=1250539 RepID=UPI001A8DA83F|nr:DUF4405 domain-containing protein [Salipiger abyssi]MBN9889404.1 DUF4405 domain-containing protein [Salipiger abyssi]
MTAFLKRIATPLITGLFLISLLSGLALFFHWNSVWFHSMHEWLSLLLILPFVLHIWKNWRPMLGYLRRPIFAGTLAASALAAAAFVVPTLGREQSGGRPPVFAVAQKMLDGSVAEVAAVIGETPEALSAALRSAGFAVADADQSLNELADASGRARNDLFAVLAR